MPDTAQEPQEQPETLGYVQAGGNAGGDVDQDGRPVVDGKWYVTLGPDDWNRRIVAGPYDDEATVRMVLNLRPID